MKPDVARNSLRAGDLVGLESSDPHVDEPYLEYVRVVDVGENGILAYGPATGSPRDLFGVAFDLIEDYRPREHEAKADPEYRRYVDEKDRDSPAVFDVHPSLAALEPPLDETQKESSGDVDDEELVEAFVEELEDLDEEDRKESSGDVASGDQEGEPQ